MLDGVDLDLERGKVNVILGASGCFGKSVLIKHFMCLLRARSAGHIYVDGTDVF